MEDIDLDLLEYLVYTDTDYIKAAVADTSYLPRTVLGVGTFLLDNSGDIDLLTAKQQVTFAKFLRPLLFDVACQGIAGPETCIGNGRIEEDLLLSCYQDNIFRCRKCRNAIAESGAE
jgi:hypothetical protein